MKRATQATICAVFVLLCSGCSGEHGGGPPIVRHEGATAAFSADKGKTRLGDADTHPRYDTARDRDALDTVRATDPDAENDARATESDDNEVVKVATDGVDGDMPYSGEFLVLTYNVAGLPDFISRSNPSVNIPIISPLLNGYALVLVQEDFWYRSQLAAKVLHPYRSEPSVASPMPWAMGDGLTRFSQFSFQDLVRVAWDACNGVIHADQDCLTNKGFSVAVTALQPGTWLCVYNLHMDAGSGDGDIKARRQQIEQLAADMMTRCPGRAIIAAGDTNLRVGRPADMSILRAFLAHSGLKDSCSVLSCGDERIDRILFRSSPSLAITPLKWNIPDAFVNASGDDLSDHAPVAVQFRWAVSE